MLALWDRFALFKPRIGLSIAITTLTGALLVPASSQVIRMTWDDWVVLALATFLSAAAVGCFNQFYDYDIDQHMKRTRNRPFATGQLARHTGWLWIIGALLVLPLALLTAMGHALPAFFTLLGAFTYAVIYTIWLKRRTWSSVVVGGLAGSFAILAGSTMTAPISTPLPLAVALVLFLWTPPHFWSLAIALREDFSAAGIPVLPVCIGDRATSWVILAHTVVLVITSYLPLYVGMGWIYAGSVTIGNALFLWHSIQLVRQTDTTVARRNFHISLFHLGSLLLGAMLQSVFV
jgi:protoheme IX farnesyltransferase